MATMDDVCNCCGKPLPDGHNPWLDLPVCDDCGAAKKSFMSFEAINLAVARLAKQEARITARLELGEIILSRQGSRDFYLPPQRIPGVIEQLQALYQQYVDVYPTPKPRRKAALQTTTTK